MKRLIAFSFLCAVLSGSAAVVLEWDANNETNIAGYRVFWGGMSRSYENFADVGNVTAFTNDFILGNHFLAVTAYNTDGLESDFSEELALFIVSPPTPRFESNVLTWEGTGSWRVRWSNDTSINTQIFLTNRVALGTFPAGSALAVQCFDLGATNVVSDYSVPLYFNPPAVAHALQIRVFLERSGVTQSFTPFAEGSFFDEAGTQAFYRARLEIVRTGLRVK